MRAYCLYRLKIVLKILANCAHGKFGIEICAVVAQILLFLGRGSLEFENQGADTLNSRAILTDD